MEGTYDNKETPFGDPSQFNSSMYYSTPTVQSDTSRINSNVLDDYNPFMVSTTDQLPRKNHQLPESPPPYSATQAGMLTTAELERRQRELDAKAAELARREEEHRAREHQSRLLLQGTPNNWPPLPSFCPCAPCFYQNIELEINTEYQKIVKWGYYLWLSYAILLAVNLLTAFVFFVGTSASSGGTLFGVSIVVFIICIPSSYVCWFRPLYKAFRNNSSINFFIFFFVFAVQLFVMLVQSVGISNWGSCGWITGLSVVKLFPVIGCMTLLVAAVFTAITVASFLYIIRVHHIFRTTGASFGKAREEFTHGVSTDPFVRGAAAEAGLFASRQAT